MTQLALVLAVALLPQGQESEILFDGIGRHTRQVQTASAKADRFFQQGLNFMYAFNHGEAKRSFRAAVKHDPSFAMGWWGLAMANGPHINNMVVEPDEEREAVSAMANAAANSSKESAANRALIRAVQVRFKDPQPKDRGPLDRAYAAEMAQVWKQFPGDADVGALYAESLMDLWPWNLWTHDGKPTSKDTTTIVATLERVLRLNGRHPFALHLYIHSVEASPTPERAVAAADRLRDLQPALGHNVHMPSHIDVRVGAWRKAIIANTKAIAADKAYRERRPRQTIYRLYMAHNHHMLAFAAMMLGERDRAVKQIDTMVDEVPEDFREQVAPFMDGFFSMPFEVRVRFGMWDEVLALPDLPDYFPISKALRRAARAVSYAAKGMAAEARAEQSAFFASRRSVPNEAVFGNNSAEAILLVAAHLMNGEILIAESKPEAALRELRLAVKAEDALRYDEPPDWIQPTRHTLGAYLVQLKKFKEAADVYREDLRRLPNNGWSLFGLSESLIALGKKKEAVELRKRFDELWANADVTITSSCLCIEGGKP